ncbi:MAG: Rieske 2Fe-2S domain-containing protein [Gemmatimonadetes bacterium]|nr:Rieske 2Fe-2S domain-containing protein [Gemmatimonadota bacterium]
MSDSTGLNEDAACEGWRIDPAPPEFLKEIGLAAMGALLPGRHPGRAGRDDAAAGRAASGRVGADPTYPVPAADGVQIDKVNEVILVRWQSSVWAFNLSCPHQRTALRWTDAKHEFQCPKHKSRYQPDGTFIAGRATRNMDRFSITHTGTEIIVHVGAMHKSDADQASWSASVVKL